MWLFNKIFTSKKQINNNEAVNDQKSETQLETSSEKPLAKPKETAIFFANKPDNTLASTRDGFGEGLVLAGKENSKVVALCADLTESMKMDAFAKQFPERFIQVGVAEQNLIGVSAGMSLAGKIAFAGSFAVFSPGRSLDQIRTSVAYSKLNVKIVGGHAGLCATGDGATHQALEDIAIMRSLPNMTVIVPADAKQAKLATLALSKHNGPAYLRIGKTNTPNYSHDDFTIGQAEVLKTGSDISLIACGTMVHQAMQASQKLEKLGISSQIINLHTIKPLDQETILQATKQTGAILTLEEHQQAGGLAGAILETIGLSYKKTNTNGEMLLEKIPVFDSIAINDKFGQSGSLDELYEYYGLDVKTIVKKAVELVKQKN